VSSGYEQAISALADLAARFLAEARVPLSFVNHEFLATAVD
jgi:hypothetical protein